RGRVQVRVRVVQLDAAALSELAQAGMQIEITNESLRVARGWIDAAAISALAALENVQHVGPPDYGFTRIGSVDGEHDHILRCDQVRATYGVDGTEVRVGVISDGIDHISSSQAKGDAPLATVPRDPR